MPSPRPQAWQSLQQAVGLGEAGAPSVSLIADAPILDGVPSSLADWMGRELPAEVQVKVPTRRSRPPWAGVRFRHQLRGLRSRDSILLCRDPRVAASEAGRWRAVLHEWHVRPDPGNSVHLAALRGVDHHITPAPGIAVDLAEAGIPPDRVHLLPNACGLDPLRADGRRRSPGSGVLAMGLHRREGLETAFAAWALDPTLPVLQIAGRDQGGARVDAWAGDSPDPRIRFLGPVWGKAREDLLDTAAVWLAPYPDGELTRTRLCPLQVADALGSGLGVVAPDLPSIQALAGPPPSALTAYEVDDPNSLGAAVHRALRSPPPTATRRPTWVDRAQCLRRVVS
jgi:hypothetical protein